MRLCSITAGLVLLLAPFSARASGNEAAAEALFVEAQKLVKQGKYAEACPKFAESNRLDRGAGTLIHLGNCYEKNKQTASAWATYKEAASAAQALGRADWQKLAAQHAAALEPKLAKLTITVATTVDKLAVTKDGEPFSRASWGVALPVDVGAHAIEASAPGYKTFTAKVDVASDGDQMNIVIPKLEAVAPPGPLVAAESSGSTSTSTSTSGPPTSAEHTGGSAQRTIGYVVAGLGVAGLAVGGATGLMAIGKNNEATDKCPNAGACANKEGVDANDAAKSLGLVSTIALGAGATAVIGGAVLVLTAPKASSTEAHRMRVVPRASADGGGVVVSGAF